jgi:hypothetical protein
MDHYVVHGTHFRRGPNGACGMTLSNEL